MFRSKTVFVVGAGASCEFDLPSGAKLKEQIATALDFRFDMFGRQERGDLHIIRALQSSVKGEHISSVNPFMPKAKMIRENMPAAISIDNFLDAHQGDKELETCGKLAIVKCILDAEKASKLRKIDDFRSQYEPSRIGDTWALRFMRVLTESVRRDDLDVIFDNIAMVVFNYDRCIERFIPQALSSYYGISEQDAEGITSRLRIYHPYGQVGHLPSSGRAGVGFGESERNDLFEISQGIKTFTEGQDDEKVMGPIHQVMAEAETIVFLGFAYHQQNLDLIMPDRMSVRRTFGTCQGISANDTLDIAASLQKAFGYGDSNPLVAETMHNIHLHRSTCAGLFDEFSRSLSSALR